MLAQMTTTALSASSGRSAGEPPINLSQVVIVQEETSGDNDNNARCFVDLQVPIIGTAEETNMPVGVTNNPNAAVALVDRLLQDTTTIFGRWNTTNPSQSFTLPPDFSRKAWSLPNPKSDNTASSPQTLKEVEVARFQDGARYFVGLSCYHHTVAKDKTLQPSGKLALSAMILGTGEKAEILSLMGEAVFKNAMLENPSETNFHSVLDKFSENTLVRKKMALLRGILDSLKSSDSVLFDQVCENEFMLYCTIDNKEQPVGYIFFDDDTNQMRVCFDDNTKIGENIGSLSIRSSQMDGAKRPLVDISSAGEFLKVTLGAPAISTRYWVEHITPLTGISP